MYQHPTTDESEGENHQSEFLHLFFYSSRKKLQPFLEYCKNIVKNIISFLLNLRLSFLLKKIIIICHLIYYKFFFANVRISKISFNFTSIFLCIIIIIITFSNFRLTILKYFSAYLKKYCQSQVTFSFVL